MSQTPSERYHVYNVWNAPMRWFHGINALAVLGLISVGVMLLNDDALGLSAGGKVQLKQIHVALGYVMALRRFVWACLGNRYARWRAMLPYGPGYWGALRSYATSFLSGEPQQYVGHNPAMDQDAYETMRAFRFPVVTIHLYAFYALAVVILTHLAAVIVTEIHEGGSIMSAMFTGRKILNRPPQDV